MEGYRGEGRLTLGEISGFAEAVAASLGAVVPDGFSCIASDSVVILVRGHVAVRNLDLADAPEWRVESRADDLRVVLWQVLSDFQDEIIEQLGRAWPAIPGAVGIAVPHARLENGSVRAWYGNDEAIVVALEPIPADRPDEAGGGGRH